MEDQTMSSEQNALPLLCFSHLRWNFVYQRPQHLLSRCAKTRKVFFIEEPVEDKVSKPSLKTAQPATNLHVITPQFPEGFAPNKTTGVLESLIDELVAHHRVHTYDAWYYTPMALSFTKKLSPEVIIYDCMDELSGFLGAPQELKDLEAELFDKADLVFTGGQSLYEAKLGRHPSVHCFPSSIEMAHFLRARKAKNEPEDQASISHPKIGFFGVIDERLDIELVGKIATLRPDWQFIFLGPIVKISEEMLPRNKNIHYLGMKSYQDLPEYLSGWDVAILPFAHNAATRYISPTKTPEYLAAGKPVVSTSVRDVVRPYGELGLISIADTPEEFVKAIEFEMHRTNDPQWREEVDTFLSKNSWDKTWKDMAALIENARWVSDSSRRDFVKFSNSEIALSR